MSHEAIYQLIYALRRGGQANHGVMVSIDDRPAKVAVRCVPGHGEGDLIIGKNSTTAAVRLVERATLVTTIVALPAGRPSDEVVDAIIQHANTVPAMMKKSITWDQGS